MRVLRIVEGTSVDGPGLRTSVYFAGCSHHCAGCHNPQSWDFGGGEPKSVESILHAVAAADEPVTLTGGDPLQQPLDELLRLVKAIKARDSRPLWCYTGYTWEQLCTMPDVMKVAREIDVLVDSPFVMSQRDTSLTFRGSRNQRVIDVAATLAGGELREVSFSNGVGRW